MSATPHPGEPTLADFDFELPAGRIAQTPASRREDARLMLVDRKGVAPVAHAHVSALPDLVSGDELLLVNDAKVVPARLIGRKASGGRVEFLVLESSADDPTLVRAMGRASKGIKAGTAVQIAPGVAVEVVHSLGDGLYDLRLPGGEDEPWSFLDAHGELPLPPYIARPEGPTEADAERYQTVFASQPGSVAAPTAGLHFTEPLVAALRARGCQLLPVTLHVGPGTFLPVRTERLADHRMHRERYAIPEATAQAIAEARRDGRPVLAVGTTVVRAVESAADASGAVRPGEGSTDIFIRPGYTFRVVDQLLTNFHLPGSTLLMLVAAFARLETVRAAYRTAVADGYRFFSYGDGMLLR
ncbi:MAG: tRNA preQ1(34) S-adenosylmethionine ribosyltransferase-isomerase QueA [Deltaproteobacteria bacterium]|nr:tRNA preQ1(34) S-adenosylmethionine ribosyltransferase-isomerase QueA [Deltaproteobacteria bacterium]